MRLFRRLIIAVSLLGVIAAAPRAAAQAPGEDEHVPAAAQTLIPVTPGALYRRVHTFDFNERPLGNFEDAPMHWTRLRGPGLPIYNRGQFDEEVGHDAAPSYHLQIQSGNVAYDFTSSTISVVPQADYFVTGYIQPDRLDAAGAFVAAYLVDRFGKAIPASHRVSGLVRATGRDPEPWQRVEIALPGDFPEARALRLQMWVLQGSAWRKSDPQTVDPIERRDIYAGAHFDDLTVYSLPRARLQFSAAGNVVRTGEPASVVLSITNANPTPLTAHLRVFDAAGSEVYTDDREIPVASDPIRFFQVGFEKADYSSRRNRDGGQSQSVIETPLPLLPAGGYRAQLSIHDGSDRLLARTLRFTVVEPLESSNAPAADLGLDLGRWRGGRMSDLRALMGAVGTHAAKIGISPDAISVGANASTRDDLPALLRALSQDGVDLTGVIETPASAERASTSAVRAFIEREKNWRDRFEPVFNRVGALLPAWQLGNERTELEGGRGWTPAEVAQVRKYLRGFISIPQLIVPRSATDLHAVGEDVASVWIPTDIPTRSLVRHLAFLADQSAARRWVALDDDREDLLSDKWRAIELARRIILAKALSPERLFVPAPFELTASSGELSWQPNKSFPIVRTAFRVLSGTRAVATMAPRPETIAILFDGAGSSCLCIWTWNERPDAEPVGLYLGSRATAIDAWGATVPLEHADGLTLIRPRPTPILIRNLHVPLALLQASFRVSPHSVQLHNPEPRPVLSFRNPYPTLLTGNLRISAPAIWNVEPKLKQFALEPGQTLAQALDLRLPPRQIATTSDLSIRLTINSPQRHVLDFREPIAVGLRGLRLDATAHFDGDQLIVEQTLHNQSSREISFSAFCDAPMRPRSEEFFLNVAPGEMPTLRYVYENARELAGARLVTGIQEVRGERSLYVLVKVPE